MQSAVVYHGAQHPSGFTILLRAGLGRGSDILDRFPLLPDYLRRWCLGDTSAPVIRYLLLVATALARRYSPRRLSAAVAHEEVAPEQMAKSVASVLFIKPGPCSPLCAALQPYVNDDVRLVARFISYATTAINNEFFARWQTSDPSGYDLRERLKEALKGSNYHCWPKMRPVWVRLTQTQELSPLKLPWSEPELTQIACVTANSANPNMPEWLIAIMSEISNEEGRQKFVEIDDLFESVRIAVGILLESQSTGDVQTPFLDPATRVRIRKEIERACANGHGYIDRYCIRKKPQETDQRTLHSSLDAYVEDVKAHGQPRLSQEKYVKEQTPEITDEYYQRHLKSPFQGGIAYFWQQLTKFR